jgi:hypothetical protein
LNFIGTINTPNYVNSDGPVYIVNGGIGNPEGNEYVQTRSNESSVIITDPGFDILTISDASHVTYTYYRTYDLAQLDQINIIKDR